MTSTLTIFLSFSLIVLIATKVADIWTTHRGIVKAAGRCDLEQNPIARYAMKRWGLWQTYSFISILWLMIVAFCYYPAYHAPWWYQLATALGGTVVAFVQGDVARANHTGKSSSLTRFLLRCCRLFR
jgi:hypothetical protein